MALVEEPNQLVDYATPLHFSQVHQVFMRAFWAGQPTQNQLTPATSYSGAMRSVLGGKTGQVILKTYSKTFRINRGTEEEGRKIYDDAAAMLRRCWRAETCSQTY